MTSELSAASTMGGLSAGAANALPEGAADVLPAGAGNVVSAGAGNAVSDSETNPASDLGVVVTVPAKVNLALCVGPRRDDGYHDLATVFQAVSLFDEVTATPRDDGRIVLRMSGEGSEELPCDQTNLAVRAALLLRERATGDSAGLGANRTGQPEKRSDEGDLAQLGVNLSIVKQIPMAGGMAGGSGDAAATLLACNQIWGLGLPLDELAVLGAELGSDVSFLLYGGNALGLGRGEQLTPQPATGRLEWVFATAPRGLSTPVVYRHFDEMAERGIIRPDVELSSEALDDLCSGDAQRVAPRLRNDLQAPAIDLYPQLADTLDAGMKAGALAALVSGSGPTCAFLAADAAAADALAVSLAAMAIEVRDVRRAFGPVSGPRVATTRG